MKKLLFISYLLASLGVVAQTEAERTTLFNLKGNIALAGFDPVSYFQEKPVKGKPTFKHIYKGVTYFFSNPQHRDVFKSDPEKYEPAYGGWCAYSMGHSGEKVEVDPFTFKIVNGEVYFFYNQLSNNTLDKWTLDEVKLKAKADKNWEKMRQKSLEAK